VPLLGETAIGTGFRAAAPRCSERVYGPSQIEQRGPNSERGHCRGDSTQRRAPDNAGSGRPTSDVTARKPRYYGRFSQWVLWRDIMCEETS
jgi:hypothetical protein